MRRVPTDVPGLTELLAAGGFVAAPEEAVELLACAFGDAEMLAAMVERRLTGEPLAWITGTAPFCGRWIRVDPGVYVPRWQSEPLALRAAERLPPGGVAVEPCCGSAAIARTLMDRVPDARVIATDVDAHAVACAAANGVAALEGDLLAPLPGDLAGTVDVVVAVAPYVPTAELEFLQRDTFTFEHPLSYDGGADGADVLRRLVAESPRVLRPGGALLLEIGGEQAEALRGDLARHRFVDARVRTDEDGDVRAIEATLG
jgi:release factor glutamine methyltransferase